MCLEVDVVCPVDDVGLVVGCCVIGVAGVDGLSVLLG